jgi:hypothetical protein
LWRKREAVVWRKITAGDSLLEVGQPLKGVIMIRVDTPKVLS